MADVCACEIHESGRGLSPCMHHDQRIEEHQRMFQALNSIAQDSAEDPAAVAEAALSSEPHVRYWHRDHPREVVR
jgi:hypothetical protein